VLNTVIPPHDETPLGIEDVLPIPLCRIDSCASRIHLFEMIQVGAHDLIVAARDTSAHYMFLLVAAGFLVRSLRNTLGGTMTMRGPLAVWHIRFGKYSEDTIFDRRETMFDHGFAKPYV
jgi:hypothetical protein